MLSCAKIMVLRLAQPSNAQLPMDLTLEGIVMLVSPAERSNAPLPIVSSRLPGEKVTIVRTLQSENASLWMEVTFAGIHTKLKGTPVPTSIVPLRVSPCGPTIVPVQGMLWRVISLTSLQPPQTALWMQGVWGIIATQVFHVWAFESTGAPIRDSVWVMS